MVMKQPKCPYVISVCDIMKNWKVYANLRVPETYGSFRIEQEPHVCYKDSYLGNRRNNWVGQGYSWYFWVSFFQRIFRITFFSLHLRMMRKLLYVDGTWNSKKFEIWSEVGLCVSSNFTSLWTRISSKFRKNWQLLLYSLIWNTKH